ncbi:hypothetical protein TNCV_1471331 [Trichonephila clavipes]|nr:hypothetical protein TNCV_1471331 [Trichonephila clavipes]
MKITPLKVLRIDADKTLRLSVAFQFTECPRTGSKKFPLGQESGKISRTQLQLSEECRKHQVSHLNMGSKYGLWDSKTLYVVKTQIDIGKREKLERKIKEC